MSRALLVLASLLLAFPCFAKVKMTKAGFAKKGVIDIGGGIRYESKTHEQDGEEGNTKKTFMFSPSVGYFVMKGLEIGLTIDYNSTTDEPKDGDSTSASEMLAGPFVGYYHRVSPFLFPYARASFEYLMSADNDALKDVDISGNDLAVEGGLAIAMGKRSGGTVQIGVGYESVSRTYSASGNDQEHKDSGLFFGTRFTLYFR